MDSTTRSTSIAEQDVREVARDGTEVTETARNNNQVSRG